MSDKPKGGPVLPGWYCTERGPELLITGGKVRVIPHQATKAMLTKDDA